MVRAPVFGCLRIQWLNRFCLRFRGLYVAVRGISGTGARPHVHIADSVPAVSLVRCYFRRSGICGGAGGSGL